MLPLQTKKPISVTSKDRVYTHPSLSIVPCAALKTGPEPHHHCYRKIDSDFTNSANQLCNTLRQCLQILTSLSNYDQLNKALLELLPVVVKVVNWSSCQPLRDLLLKVFAL